MNFIKHAIIAGTLVFSTINVATAATLSIDPRDSTLLGASGVNVLGTIYDVTFGDGDLSKSISAFTTAAGAEAASFALLSQVFIGVYDEIPSYTNGCIDPIHCYVFTPYSTLPIPPSIPLVGSAFALNTDDLRSSYETAGISFGPSRDTGVDGSLALATWTVAEVPEPETYAMFLAGLGVLGFVSRRRKQKAAV